MDCDGSERDSYGHDSVGFYRAHDEYHDLCHVHDLSHVHDLCHVHDHVPDRDHVLYHDHVLFLALFFHRVDSSLSMDGVHMEDVWVQVQECDLVDRTWNWVWLLCICFSLYGRDGNLKRLTKGKGDKSLMIGLDGIWYRLLFFYKLSFWSTHSRVKYHRLLTLK